MTKLTPAQSQIARDTHRFRVVDAGRRFGKSTLISWEMFALAISQPNARVPYYAPTRDDARDIMWGMLKKVSEPLITSVNEGRLEITVRNNFGGTSQMLLYGWESVQERGKGVGVKNNHIYLDEVSKYKNFWQGWQEILRPTLTDLAGGATFISTPNGFNHFFDLYNLEQTDNDYKSFHFTSYDNPHLPVEEIDKARQELTEDRFAQEYLADFRKTEGLVYKEFDRTRHIFDELPEVQFIETIAGVDFGFTHPCAVQTIKKDFDGRYWLTNEWYKTGQTDAQIGEYVASQNFAKVYPDPENAGGIQELRNRGVNVREVNKGANSVVTGINVVRELFKANRLFIHRSCVNTIRELEVYSYAPLVKGASYENENPIKENDDACFIAGTVVNGKTIESIGVQTGIKDVYEYDIAGEVLTATSNHSIYSSRGVVSIDTLRYNDVIWKRNILFTTVLDSVDIRTLFVGSIKIIILVLKRCLEASALCYTDIYGLKREELSPKDFIYIMLMATPQIIKYLIYSVLALVNTARYILQKNVVLKLENILKMSLLQLLNGLKQLKVKNAEQRLERLIQNIYPAIRLRENVTCVEKNIPAKNQTADGVITIADKRRYVGHVPVFNLRTRSGMYLANNILVKNCDALRYPIMMDSSDNRSDKPVVHYGTVHTYGKQQTPFNRLRL